MRLLLAVQLLVAAVVGVAMIVAPSVSDQWPWPMTPLTSRAAGSWICAVGATAAVMLWENDLSRLMASMYGLATFGALQLVALLRYTDTVDWNGAAAWFYVAFMVSLVLVSVAGITSRWRAGSSQQAILEAQ